MGCGGHSSHRPIPAGCCGSDYTTEHEQPQMHPELPLEILKKRYARGEISKEEFEQMKKDLTGGESESVPKHGSSGEPAKEIMPSTTVPGIKKASIRDQREKDVLASPGVRAYNPLLLGIAIFSLIFVIVIGLLVNPLGWILFPIIILGSAGLIYIAYAIWRINRAKKDAMEKTADMARLETTQEIAERNEIGEIEQKLLAGFSEIKMNEGIAIFKDLKGEYAALEQFYLSNDSIDRSLINTDKMKETIKEVYRKALDLLATALDFSKQVSSIEISELEKENKDIEQEIKTRESQNLPYLSLKDRLDKNTENITLAKTNYTKIDELLHQAGLCERLLRKARCQLPELTSHSPKEDPGSIDS